MKIKTLCEYVESIMNLKKIKSIIIELPTGINADRFLKREGFEEFNTFDDGDTLYINKKKNINIILSCTKIAILCERST